MAFIIGPGNGGSDRSGGGSDEGLANRVTATETVNLQQGLEIETLKAGLLASEADREAFGERIDDVEGSIVDFTPEIQAINQKDEDQDTLISLATSSNEAQDLLIATLDSISVSTISRVVNLEEVLPNKADLVSGKIPLSQLPDLPVGRKISVADSVARLALSQHSDLTIAYETDSGDAWALDANEDPSNPSNWDKLGNAQAIGVQSFNGRTGNVSPQSGDYDTNMILPTTERSFISNNDRTRWDNNATPAQVTAAVSGLRSEVQSAYIPTTQRGVEGGVATLGSDGKVVPTQLPPLGMTATQAQRLTQVESTANLADQKGDLAATNILAVDQRLTQVDTDVRASVTALESTVGTNKTASETRDTAQNTRLTALETKTAAANIPLSQKSANNGVAPLDAAGKVPLINLPAFLPQGGRIWRDVKASRVVGQYYINETGNERVIYIRCTTSTDAQRYLRGVIREASGQTVFDFRSDAVGAAGNRWFHITMHVPPRWQFALDAAGGSTTANIEYWHELY